MKQIMLSIHFKCMKKLSDIIKCFSCGHERSVPVLEMATISKQLRAGNTTYKVAVHGPSSKDRDYPHIHIYKSNDTYPYREFNFEISLIDLLCYDELNLVAMVDKDNKIHIKHRNKCHWAGYRDLRDEFEDWLGRPSDFPGNFNNNLEAIVWAYDNESNDKDALVNYIKDHGKKVNEKYKRCFDK